MIPRLRVVLDQGLFVILELILGSNFFSARQPSNIPSALCCLCYQLGGYAYYYKILLPVHVGKGILPKPFFLCLSEQT